MFKPHGMKSVRFTSFALCSAFLILTLLQLLHLYSSSGSNIIQELTDRLPTTAGSSQTNKDNIDIKNAYFSSDGLTVVKSKPDKQSQADAISQAMESADDIFFIHDFTEEEYYGNKEYGDYSDTEKIDDQLVSDQEFKKFINEELLQKVLDAAPSVKAINNKIHYNKKNPYETSWDKKIPVLDGKLRENRGSEPIRTKEYLNKFLQINQAEFNSLQESHDKIMDTLPKSFPDSIAENIKGKGILYAGGGTYNWLVLLSIKMLRDTGSKLPVEVFIPTDSEYSADLCNRIFPAFGAKCILMSNYIDTRKFKLKGYQLKSMALLLTSFEDVLMMDSDNIPMKNPDILFINEPYIGNGLVVWPDFWRRSTKPDFYDIARIPVNETNQVRVSYGDERDHHQPMETLEDYNTWMSYHDLEGTFPEASAETGQLLINKKTHAQAIFLSLYYNYYGPNYYYGLFSQGQAGEGDKETILAAAHKCGLPYYQVQEYIREYGEMTNTYEFHISAMGQYDPILDHIQSQDPLKYKDTSKVYDRTKVNYLMHKYSQSETIFLHCNQPKLYPWKVDGNGFRMIHDSAGNRRRLYSKALIQELGFDAEAKIWETMEWMLCKHGDMNIKGMRTPDVWCTKVKEQLEFLRNDQLPEGMDAAEAEGMSEEQVQQRQEQKEKEEQEAEERRLQEEKDKEQNGDGETENNDEKKKDEKKDEKKEEKKDEKKDENKDQKKDDQKDDKTTEGEESPELVGVVNVVDDS